MIATYVDAMPSTVLAPAGPVLTVTGASVVLAVLVAIVAIAAGVFLQWAMASRSRTSSGLRALPGGTGAPARRAA